MFSYQLNKNEKLIRIVRRHPITFIFSVLKAALLFAVVGIGGYWIFSLYKENFKELAFLGGLFLAGVYLSLKWMVWITTVYIITSERVVDINHQGLFRKIVTEAEFGDVQEVLYEINGFIATLCGLGNVFIKTQDGTIAMEGVYKPAKIYKIIIEIKNTR